MSGSGGFYKYRCKYFFSHNCPNWVYVNGAACAHCVADGRESEETEAASIPARRLSQEICVPQVCDGTLQYTLMEFVESGTGNYWAVRYKLPAVQQPLITGAVATTDTPRPVMATTGVSGQMGYMGHHHMGGPMGY